MAKMLLRILTGSQPTSHLVDKQSVIVSYGTNNNFQTKISLSTYTKYMKIYQAQMNGNTKTMLPHILFMAAVKYKFLFLN